MGYTHFNEAGRAHMVDVSEKKVTTRTAIASGIIKMDERVIHTIKEGQMKKGDVLAVAQVAGIMGAKQTSQLVPMCHPVMLTKVDIDFQIHSNYIKIIAYAKTDHKTGVEMEALTAVTVTTLTIYDMCKSMGYKMVIGDVQLDKKTGGKSDYTRGMGRVLSLNISDKKGVKKVPVEKVICEENMGIENDAHRGPGNRQVSLLAKESIVKVEAKMGELKNGSFAENITTEGIELFSLPIGTKLQIGETLHQVSQIGKECHTGCEISKMVGQCVMPIEGIFTKVIKGGEIHVGDIIERIEEK